MHPQEDLLADARVVQESTHAHNQLRKRQTVEHRTGRLKQLGIRRSRYRSRRKTALQLRLASAVANPMLVLAVAAGGLGLVALLLVRLGSQVIGDCHR